MQSFNSRTREGCDLVRVFSVDASVVSIHAPGRGATVLSSEVSQADKVSIHAPGRGATPGINFSEGCTIVSIHAPGRGATPILDLLL